MAGRLRGVDPKDLVAVRRAYDAFSEKDPLPEGAEETHVTVGGVPCLGVLPRGVTGENVVLWLHGGAYQLGSSRSHRGFSAWFGHHARAAALTPNYRLAPEHPYPAALDDAAKVYRAVLGEGVAPSRIILAGDSAGGGLALALAHRLRAEGGPAPAGMVLMSPWVDLTHSGWSHRTKGARDYLTLDGLKEAARDYLGSIPPNDPRIALLDADLRGLPPTLIQAGEAELLLSDSTTLAERLGGAGVPVTLEIWPDMPHVFQARYSYLTHARAALERAGKWAAAHLLLAGA